MRILIYNPTRKNITPLLRLSEQQGLYSEIVETEERFTYLLSTDSYCAILLTYVHVFEIISKLYRQWKSMAKNGRFIVISACESGLLRARSLELGVDQYYIEPFSQLQMVGEIIHTSYLLPIGEEYFQTRRFKVNLLARSISFQDKPLKLSRKEFDLLSFLLRRRGSVVTRAQMWEEVWGYDRYPLANTVDVHLARIRKKLGCKGDIIVTVHGIGYRLDELL